MHFSKYPLPLLLCLSLAVWSGCDMSPEAKLIGKWEADHVPIIEKTKAKFGDSISPEMLYQIEERIRLQNSFTKEFQKDGKVITFKSTHGHDRHEMAEWKFDRMEDGEMYITLTPVNEEPRTMAIKFTSNTRMQMRDTADPDPDRASYLRRMAR